MIEVTALRNGTYFEEDGTPFEVVSYEHIKLGRGTANIKIRAKNLLTGAIISKGYISGKRVDEADIEEKIASFLYRTRDSYVFSREDEDEEIEIPISKVGESGRFLKKGMEVKILSYEEEPLTFTLPIKAVFKVKEAPPDARGNTVSASYKEVLLENNLKVKVPMFIDEGEEVVVDTRTGTYVERAK